MENEKISPDFMENFLDIEKYENGGLHFSLEDCNKKKECLFSHIDWILNINSRRTIQEYFKKNYSDSNKAIYIQFMDYFGKICEKIYKDNKSFFEENEDLSKKVFELINEFKNYQIHFYNIKIYFSTSENKYEEYLMDVLFFSFHRYLDKYKKFNIFFGHNKAGISYRSGLENYGVLMEFFFPETNIVNYNILYLKILPPEIFEILSFRDTLKEEKLFIENEYKIEWSKIPNDFKFEFEKIIYTLHLLKNAYFITTFNLYTEIEQKINLFNQKHLNLDYIINKNYELNKILTYENDDFSFKLTNFNVFLGKNNTGKTYALKTIFEKIQNHKYSLEVKSTQKQFFHYIPNLRFLDNSEGVYNDLSVGILKLFTSLFFLQHQEILQFNLFLSKENLSSSYPNLDVEIPEVKNANIWVIPNFTEILDSFSTDFKEIDRFVDTDKDLIKETFPLLVGFKEIYEKWKNIISNFFKDIKVKDPVRIGRGAKFRFKIKETFFKNKELEDWVQIGSGVQQLLSIIFFIEFIRLGPSIDLFKFKEIFRGNNYAEALVESIDNNYRNKYIFIDEPEISLHPSLLKNFFEYLYSISKEIQIFIATHSPSFLSIDYLKKQIGNKVIIYLMKKDSEKEFWSEQINNDNIYEIYDELFSYNPLETSIFFYKNNYSDFIKSNFNPKKLLMIQRLIENRFENDEKLNGLLKLGTINEDINERLLQNTYFLSFQPELINLQNNEDIEYNLKQIIIFQINKTNDSNRIQLDELKKRLEQEKRFSEREIRKKINIRVFLNLWSECWNFRYFKDYILTYSKEQALKRSEFIINKLNEIKDSEIIQYKTLILFPENSIPYESIDQLIDFADDKKIILIGGLEHKSLKEIMTEFNKLGDKYNEYCKDKIDYKNLPVYNSRSEEIFINQAIIINANKYFSFQLKNTPFYSNLFNKKEGINTSVEPSFRKFKTSIGKIGVFICKDFLVNYSVIDKWMERNNIKVIAIPSFSELVNPFLYKFGEIISKPENRNKTFIFANIAEYGGSGAYNFSNRRVYEPYESSLFDKRKEGYKILNIK